MDSNWFTDCEPSTRWPHYTRVIASEVTPTPVTPLGQKFIWDEGISHGAVEGSCRTGFYEQDEFDPVNPEMFGFFGGYFYLNLSLLRLWGDRNPLTTVDHLESLLFGDQPDLPLHVEHPDNVKPHLKPGIDAHIARILSTNEWPELADDRSRVEVVRAGRPDLRVLGDVELVERARATLPDVVWGYSQHYVASSSTFATLAALNEVANAVGDQTIPMRLVAGIGDVDSAAASHDMWAMSRSIRHSEDLTALFDAGVDGLLARLAVIESDEAATLLADWNDFIYEHGSRGPNEWDIGAETWETKPELALALLDRVRHQCEHGSPRSRAEAAIGERRALTDDVRQKLAKAKIGSAGEDLAEVFEAAVVASSFMAFRARTMTNLIKTVHESRMVFRELGRRHGEAGTIADPLDVFMLAASELDDFVANPGSFAEVLATRHATWLQLAELEPPHIIADGEVPPLWSWPRRTVDAVPACHAGSVLRGVAGSPGVVEGRARVVLDPADPVALDPGDILIAPNTHPGWTPLFLAAGGVVVDVGGPISHAVIVSRELGLPCVTSVKGATARIPSGAIIEVDGSNGQVTVKELP